MIVAADDARKLVEVRPELSAPTSPVVAQSEIIKQMVADIDGDYSKDPYANFQSDATKDSDTSRMTDSCFLTRPAFQLSSCAGSSFNERCLID